MIVLDDMITDILSNNKLNLIVTELFMREIRLNNFLVFNTQSYFSVPKNFRLNLVWLIVLAQTNKIERL